VSVKATHYVTFSRRSLVSQEAMVCYARVLVARRQKPWNLHGVDGDSASHWNGKASTFRPISDDLTSSNCSKLQIFIYIFEHFRV